MSKALRLFIPLTKVDVQNRIVYGVVTAESPDLSGEICDYASSKPYFERWSSEISRASGGKSLGNVRAMHGAVAAGKLTDIVFNDEAKKIEVAAKIVDDDEWSKVVEGVYTGFSQGGRYVRRWRQEGDPDGVMRFTADPVEISLVDLPCLPEATFEYVKATGEVEARTFKSAAPEPSEGDIDQRVERLLYENADLSIDLARKQARAELLSEALARFIDADANGPVAAADNHGAEPADAAVVAENAVIIEEKIGGAASTLKVKPSPDATEVRQTTETAAAAVDKAFRVADGDADLLNSIIAGKFSTVLSEPVQIQVWFDGKDFHDVKKSAAKAIIARRSAAEVAAETSHLDKMLAELAGRLNIDIDDLKKRTLPAPTPIVIEDAAGLERAISAASESADVLAEKRRIIGRATDLGLTDRLPNAWKTLGLVDALMGGNAAWLKPLVAIASHMTESRKFAGEEIGDSMQALRAMAMLMDLLVVEAMDAGYNADQISALRDAIKRIKDFVASEVVEDNVPNELIARAVSMIERADAMVKRGARNSGFDQARLNAAHDLLKELGAACESKASETADSDIEKKLDAALAKNASLAETFASYGSMIQKILSDVQAIKDTPLPAGAAIRAVQKVSGADGAGRADDISTDEALARIAKMPEAERAKALMKLSLATPMDFGSLVSR